MDELMIECELCGHECENEFAMTAVILRGREYAGGFGIGKATLGKRGYEPCPQFGFYLTYDDAQSKARELNIDLGIDKTRAFDIVCSTMR